MIGVLRALGAVVVAALDAAVATAAHRWRRLTTRPDDALALIRERDAADVLGFRGPVDAAGQWRDDLAAGRIDHDGQPKAKQPCGCGKRRTS